MAKFKKADDSGNAIRPKTVPANSGRGPNWLKQKCSDILDRNKLIDFLGDVASGKYKEKVYTITGKLYERECQTNVKMTAIEMLLDRGYGKPSQESAVSLEVGGRMIIQRADK